MEHVKNAVLVSTKCSNHCHATALNISDRAVQQILHQDLNFHLHKIQIVQQLNNEDAFQDNGLASNFWSF
jgi:hypothetical protein